MTLLLFVGLDWLSLRTVLLLSQMSRHSGEAQLGRDFQQELRDRGLIDAPQTDREIPDLIGFAAPTAGSPSL